MHHVASYWQWNTAELQTSLLMNYQDSEEVILGKAVNHLSPADYLHGPMDYRGHSYMEITILMISSEADYITVNS